MVQRYFTAFLYSRVIIVLDSIRSALLQHAEELWSKAIVNAANFDNADDSAFESSTLSFSRSVTNQSDSISKMIIPKKFHNSLNSVTLTYFDRKAFFLSFGKIALMIFVLLSAVFIGVKFNWKEKALQNPYLIINERTEKFKEFFEIIQRDYYEFIDKKLNLQKNYPDILENAAGEFNLLDSQLTEIVGQVYRLQREIGNQRIDEAN